MASERTKEAARLAKRIADMTDAERAALAAKIPAIINPERHALSLRNTMLLYLQSNRDDLTMVAGFRQWQRYGRIVCKGQKSIGLIMVPMVRKAKETDDTDAETVTRFRYVPVFDVSQTKEKEVN